MHNFIKENTLKDNVHIQIRRHIFVGRDLCTVMVKWFLLMFAFRITLLPENSEGGNIIAGFNIVDMHRKCHFCKMH